MASVEEKGKGGDGERKPAATARRLAAPFAHSREASASRIASRGVQDPWFEGWYLAGVPVSAARASLPLIVAAFDCLRRPLEARSKSQDRRFPRGRRYNGASVAATAANRSTFAAPFGPGSVQQKTASFANFRMTFSAHGSEAAFVNQR